MALFRFFKAKPNAGTGTVLAVAAAAEAASSATAGAGVSGATAELDTTVAATAEAAAADATVAATAAADAAANATARTVPVVAAEMAAANATERTVPVVAPVASKRQPGLLGRKCRKIFTEMKINKVSYAMLAPFMILFFIFTVLPVVSSIALSFTYFNMLEFPKWVGWLNYKNLFLNDDVFLIAVKNTLIFAFLTGPVSYIACLIFAWFINELSPKIRAFMTLVFYAPSISGNLYFIWTFIFSGDSWGLVNSTLMNLGIRRDAVQWLTDPVYNMAVLIIVQLWLSLGTGFLAFIAGFQNVDKTLYEAGAIDGVRNRFQELIYITLPAMSEQLLFGAVMQIAVSFAVSDVSRYLCGFPSTNYSAHTVVLHIQDYGVVRYEMGYASAIAVVLFVTMILTNKLIHKILARYGK